MASLIPPPPPAPAPDGSSFSDPLWQRWFVALAGGLNKLSAWSSTWSYGPTLTTSSVDLQVSGSITATSVGQTSDERLKHRWRRLRPDFVEGLASLKEGNRAGSFAWRAGGVRAIGVGAQAVAQFCPLAVLEGADGLKRVEYGVLGTLGAVALAERALKAEARVKQLEASVCDLQERVARMERHEGLR